MGVLPDWMIEEGVKIVPFATQQHRPGVISYGLTSYGYDVRVDRRFKVFTNVYGSTVDPKNFDPKSFVDIEGVTTQSGKKQGERAARIRRYAKDVPLSDFGIEEIDAIIEFWRTRPRKSPTKKTPNGSPYAFTLCKQTIGLFKHFIRWLHKEKSFPWKKPVDLDLDRIKIVPDAETKYKIDIYEKDELALLWQYASLFERKLLLLALNCGFSISEIGSLDWSEVEGGFIKGLRPKSKVYGEFKLWDMTRQALGTPKKKGPVFLTEGGLSLIARTEGNNVSAKIPAAWYRLLNRVRKHQKEFKRLGFHHLRKTAGNESANSPMARRWASSCGTASRSSRTRWRVCTATRCSRGCSRLRTACGRSGRTSSPRSKTWNCPGKRRRNRFDKSAA